MSAKSKPPSAVRQLPVHPLHYLLLMRFRSLGIHVYAMNVEVSSAHVARAVQCTGRARTSQACAIQLDCHGGQHSFLLACQSSVILQDHRQLPAVQVASELNASCAEKGTCVQGHLEVIMPDVSLKSAILVLIRTACILQGLFDGSTDTLRVRVAGYICRESVGCGDDDQLHWYNAYCGNTFNRSWVLPSACRAAAVAVLQTTQRRMAKRIIKQTGLYTGTQLHLFRYHFG